MTYNESTGRIRLNSKVMSISSNRNEWMNQSRSTQTIDTRYQIIWLCLMNVHMEQGKSEYEWEKRQKVREGKCLVVVIVLHKTDKSTFSSVTVGNWNNRQHCRHINSFYYDKTQQLHTSKIPIKSLFCQGLCISSSHCCWRLMGCFIQHTIIALRLIHQWAE